MFLWRANERVLGHNLSGDFFLASDRQQTITHPVTSS